MQLKINSADVQNHCALAQNHEGIKLESCAPTDEIKLKLQ